MHICLSTNNYIYLGVLINTNKLLNAGAQLGKTQEYRTDRTNRLRITHAHLGVDKT